MIRIKIVFFFFQPIISLLYLDFGLPQLRLQRQQRQQQQQMLRLFSLNFYHENFFFSTFSSPYEQQKSENIEIFFSIHTFKHVQGIFFFLVLKKRYDSLITSCTRLICVNETKKKKKNKNETEKNDYEFY